MSQHRNEGGVAVDLEQTDPELAAAFARDGVACVRGVLDPAEIAAAVAAIEIVLAAPGPLAQVASGLGDPGSSLRISAAGRTSRRSRGWPATPACRRLPRR
jgi:hypothetical protein